MLGFVAVLSALALWLLKRGVGLRRVECSGCAPPPCAPSIPCRGLLARQQRELARRSRPWSTRAR